MGRIDTHEIGILSLHCSRRAVAIGALKGFSKQWSREIVGREAVRPGGGHSVGGIG